MKLDLRTFLSYLAILLLLLPGDIYEITSIHTYTSVPSLAYQWLNSPVSYIYVLIGPFLLFSNNRRLLYFSVFVFSILLWDFLFGNQFAYNKGFFESYINLVFGTLLALGVTGLVGKDSERVFEVLDIIIMLNVLLALIGALVGFGVDFNRFSLLRLNFTFMSSNETAFIAGMGLLLAFRKKSWTKVLLYLMMIFLTGSRGPLVFLVVAAGYYSLRWNIRNILKVFHFKYVIFLFSVLAFGYMASIYLPSLRILNFINDISTSNTNGIVEDVSILGRAASIVVGWQLILIRPMGLSFCFNDVQLNMNSLGYPTFPHSCLMYWYLTMGPLLSIVLFVGYFRKIRLDKVLTVPLFTYVILYIIFSGGATVNFKIIFFLALVFYMKIDSHGKCYNFT